MSTLGHVDPEPQERAELAAFGLDLTDSLIIQFGPNLALEAHRIDGDWSIGYSIDGLLLPYEVRLWCGSSEEN